MPETNESKLTTWLLLAPKGALKIWFCSTVDAYTRSIHGVRNELKAPMGVDKILLTIIATKFACK